MIPNTYEVKIGLLCTCIYVFYIFLLPFDASGFLIISSLFEELVLFF